MGPFAPLLPLIAAASQASASNGVVWHWDRDTSGCGLIQNVDEGTVLEISRTPGDGATALVIKSSKPIITVETTLHGGTLSFQPGGAVEGDATVLQGSDGRRAIYVMTRDPTFDAKFAGSTEVDFANEKIGDAKASIRAAEAATAGLRACEDNKMKSWGIDPVAWRALRVKPRPKTPPGTWIDWSDYPDREKIYKNDIDVVARLDLAADGSVQRCQVVNQPPAEFIGATCKALKQSARLFPARDASGNPTPAAYVVDVRFGAFLL